MFWTCTKPITLKPLCLDRKRAGLVPCPICCGFTTPEIASLRRRAREATLRAQRSVGGQIPSPRSAEPSKTPFRVGLVVAE